jgi:hypothetical protein
MVLAGASPLALYLPLVGRFGGAGGTRDAGVGGFHPTRLTALRALRPPSPSRGGMEQAEMLGQNPVRQACPMRFSPLDDCALFSIDRSFQRVFP